MLPKYQNVIFYPLELLEEYVDHIIPIRIESNDVFSENGSCQLKIQPLPCLQASPDARSSTPTFWEQYTSYRLSMNWNDSENVFTQRRVRANPPVIAFLWIQTQKVIDACTRILETYSRIGFLQLFSPPDLLINGIPCLPPRFRSVPNKGDLTKKIRL